MAGLGTQQLHPDPNLGPLKHDHKLTLIFFSINQLYVRDGNQWMKRGDPAVIWPRDWLPKEEEGLGDNILVLEVTCYFGGGKESWLNMGNHLVQRLVMNKTWQLDHPQTIVLVGHGDGGLMLKSFTMEVDKVSKIDKANGELQKARCKAFQQNIKGIVFYSVSYARSRKECVDYWKSYPDKQISQRFLDFTKPYSQNMVSLNVGFEKSIEQQHINLFAFVEGQKVPISLPSTSKLTWNNVCTINDVDCSQVCQPLDQQHDSYKRLLQFIQETLDDDELRLQQFNTKFNLKDSQRLDDQSTSIGLSSVVQKPHLPREAKREVETSTRTIETEGVPNQQQKLDVTTTTIETKGVPNQQQKLDVMTTTIETEGVPNQQQKLDVMITTIEDAHIKSPQDLQRLAPKEVLGETSIVCVGGKAMKGDLVEFLFMDVGDMAKVVGVGLDWAKVEVTKEFAVNVMQEDEGAWTELWCSEHFVPRMITIPNPKQELVTHPNSAKIDGVELEANLGCVYVEDDKEENAHACFPLIFELVEHIGLARKNAMKMKEVSREKSRGSTKGGEVSGVESSGSSKGGEVSGAESSGSTKGGEVSGAESSGSTKGEEISREKSSGSRQETRRNENDEGSKDPSKGPPNNLDPSLSVGPQDEEERTLIVNVHPRKGKFTTLWEGQEEPPNICPKLVFKFQKKGECRMIRSETETSCNFGEMEDEAIENGFGFYQDNITISLKCKDEDLDAASVSEPCVQDVENVKKTMTDTPTTIKNSGHQIGCEIGVVAMPYTIHDYPPHCQGNYCYTSSRGTNFTQGSNHDVPFVQLCCYRVNDRCISKGLKYNFRYPPHILQQIASSDSSGIKTENTFWATIVGNWVNLNHKMSPYVFSVKRHIISKEKLRGSKKHVGNPPHTRIQYEVKYDRSTDTHVTKQYYEVALKEVSIMGMDDVPTLGSKVACGIHCVISLDHGGLQDFATIL
ncbi:unnamed protein product [Sphagnum tenellum]